METWRIIATSLLAAGGVVLVLVTMAQARERRGSTTGGVALAGVIAFVAMLVLCLLSVTVLPSGLVWSLVVALGVIVSVLVLVS